MPMLCNLAVPKMGMGHRDRDIGTRIQGLGLRDARRGTREREVWDARMQNT